MPSWLLHAQEESKGVYNHAAAAAVFITTYTSLYRYINSRITPQQRHNARALFSHHNTEHTAPPSIHPSLSLSLSVMALNPQYEEIGKGFVQQYYLIFDDAAQRPNLVNLYNVSRVSLGVENGSPIGESDRSLWWGGVGRNITSSSLSLSLYDDTTPRLGRWLVIFICSFLIIVYHPRAPERAILYDVRGPTAAGRRQDHGETAEPHVPEDQPDYHGGGLAADVRRRRRDQCAGPVTGT